LVLDKRFLVQQKAVVGLLLRVADDPAAVVRMLTGGGKVVGIAD
jgi:hypothetical protein